MSFEWQTEETTDWDELEIEQPEPEPPRRRRWPLVLLLLVLVVGTAGVVAYHELFRRVQVGTENVEADVLASYEVVESAIRTQDNDLLTPFMSGADFEWVTTVDELVADGRFYERTPFYLQWISGGAVPTPTLTLSDDLTAAELVTTHHYAINVGNGVTETVTLEDTAVYRRGPNRWLLSPPKPEFWGQGQTTTGEILFSATRNEMPALHAGLLSILMSNCWSYVLNSLNCIAQMSWKYA